MFTTVMMVLAGVLVQSKSLPWTRWTHIRWCYQQLNNTWRALHICQRWQIEIYTYIWCQQWSWTDGKSTWQLLNNQVLQLVKDNNMEIYTNIGVINCGKTQVESQHDSSLYKQQKWINSLVDVIKQDGKPNWQFWFGPNKIPNIRISK